MARLTQRYDLVARSISHAPQQSKKASKKVSEPEIAQKPVEDKLGASNAYQLNPDDSKPKKKPRPMSSKP